MNLAKNKRITELYNQVTALKIYLSISTTVSILLFITCILFASGNLNKSNEIVAIHKEYEDMQSDYEILVEHYDGFNKTIDELVDISETLDEQNQEYYKELENYRTREELHDKYEYALFRNGERTDITYDQIITLESLMEESEIGDPDLILSIVMTESGGNEHAANSTSTAKGFGQFLNGTSQFVYTDLLGYPESEWCPEIAYNGATNLEMMVAYTDYLYEFHDGNLYKVIQSYRGKEDITSYVAVIDSYLINNDKSVQSISQSLSYSNTKGEDYIGSD